MRAESYITQHFYMHYGGEAVMRNHIQPGKGIETGKPHYQSF